MAKVPDKKEKMIREVSEFRTYIGKDTHSWYGRDKIKLFL
jgi:hypothetical protein